MPRWQLAVALHLVGCGYPQFGFDGPVDADVSDAFAEAAPNDASVDGVTSDAASEVANDAGDAADAAACPAGMSIIPGAVGAHYCIDKTEVTNGQYAAWLATMPATTGQPAECAWNTSFVPKVWPTDPSEDQRPVGNVDWCDAWSYCRAHGKRLCGHVGGGPQPTSAIDRGDSDELTRACNNGGTTVYPYTGAFDPKACNGVDLGVKARIDVGTMPSCRSPFDVYDLSGNVSEWEDACDPATDAGPTNHDLCMLRGGDFYSDMTYLRCDHGFPGYRETYDDKFGFRCCAD
jgi:formylglycine-generating enzyme required for sulfatase activity